MVEGGKNLNSKKHGDLHYNIYLLLIFISICGHGYRKGYCAQRMISNFF